jgi:hypothetical protein
MILSSSTNIFRFLAILFLDIKCQLGDYKPARLDKKESESDLFHLACRSWLSWLIIQIIAAERALTVFVQDDPYAD